MDSKFSEATPSLSKGHILLSIHLNLKGKKDHSNIINISQYLKLILVGESILTTTTKPESLSIF